MTRLRSPFFLLFVLFFMFSCSFRGGKADSVAKTREFPLPPQVPSYISGTEESAEFVCDHYWDGFFRVEENYLCDSMHVEGVTLDNIESALGMFLSVLETAVSMDYAKDRTGKFFFEIEEAQGKDTSSNVFSTMTEMVSRYLYDPNSPARNEDLYLPFVKGLCESEFTPENLRESYLHEAKCCSLNQFGTPAADFYFTTTAGRQRNLYSVKADYTLLFFTNPGCHACGEIIETLEQWEYISTLTRNGSLAVVAVYIDDEIEKWKEFSKEYPPSWTSGYDREHVIRNSQIYNVRAIPSLYLLDTEKKVILKDAPLERVIAFIESI